MARTRAFLSTYFDGHDDPLTTTRVVHAVLNHLGVRQTPKTDRAINDVIESLVESEALAVTPEWHEPQGLLPADRMEAYLERLAARGAAVMPFVKAKMLEFFKVLDRPSSLERVLAYAHPDEQALRMPKFSDELKGVFNELHRDKRIVRLPTYHGYWLRAKPLPPTPIEIEMWETRQFPWDASSLPPPYATRAGDYATIESATLAILESAAAPIGTTPLMIQVCEPLKLVVNENLGHFWTLFQKLIHAGTITRADESLPDNLIRRGWVLARRLTDGTLTATKAPEAMS